MPVTVAKSGKRDGYRVSTPGGVKAKNTSLVKAARQQRLLNAIDHGFRPTGKSATRKINEERLRRTINRRG